MRPLWKTETMAALVFGATSKGTMKNGRVECPRFVAWPIWRPHASLSCGLDHQVARAAVAGRSGGGEGTMGQRSEPFGLPILRATALAGFANRPASCHFKSAISETTKPARQLPQRVSPRFSCISLSARKLSFKSALWRSIANQRGTSSRPRTSRRFRLARPDVHCSGVSRQSLP